MKSPIQRMRELMGALPERDIALGNKFLSDRNFDSLKELVESAVYKVRKNRISEDPKPEYLAIDLGSLTQLRSEVVNYSMQLEVPQSYIPDTLCEDLSDCEIGEEYY